MVAAQCGTAIEHTEGIRSVLCAGITKRSRWPQGEHINIDSGYMQRYRRECTRQTKHGEKSMCGLYETGKIPVV